MNNGNEKTKENKKTMKICIFHVFSSRVFLSIDVLGFLVIWIFHFAH